MGAGSDGLDEPLAAARRQDLAGARDAVERGRCGGQFLGDIETGGSGELGDELLPRGEVVRQTVSARNDAKLIAAEFTEDIQQAYVTQGGCEVLGDLAPGLTRGAQSSAENAAEIEETLASKRAKDGRGGGLERHRAGAILARISHHGKEFRPYFPS